MVSATATRLKPLNAWEMALHQLDNVAKRMKLDPSLHELGFVVLPGFSACLQSEPSHWPRKVHAPL